MSVQGAITVPGCAGPSVASLASEMRKSPQRVGVFSHRPVAGLLAIIRVNDLKDGVRLLRGLSEMSAVVLEAACWRLFRGPDEGYDAHSACMRPRRLCRDR